MARVPRATGICKFASLVIIRGASVVFLRLVFTTLCVCIVDFLTVSCDTVREVTLYILIGNSVIFTVMGCQNNTLLRRHLF
jgi:hypothetical protein